MAYEDNPNEQPSDYQENNGGDLDSPILTEPKIIDPEEDAPIYEDQPVVEDDDNGDDIEDDDDDSED